MSGFGHVRPINEERLTEGQRKTKTNVDRWSESCSGEARDEIRKYMTNYSKKMEESLEENAEKIIRRVPKG